MAKVFFGKMNDEEQVNNKVYRTRNKSYLGDIKQGDFAFIKFEKEEKRATIKRLWKLQNIIEKGGEYEAYFEEVFEFTPISLDDFESLDLFVLNMNLLNKCNKPTTGRSFFELSLNDGKNDFESLAKDKEKFQAYIDDKRNYRKFVIVESKKLVSQDSIDVHFYKENDSWKLFNASFIGEDLNAKFDSSQYELFDKEGNNSKSTPKAKMYRFLAGMSDEAPLMGLWDLFCGKVNTKKSSAEKDLQAASGDKMPDQETSNQTITSDYYGVNEIFYGVPGCGKSYYVDNTVLNDQDYVLRTTFYADYSNADFVGQILPQIKGSSVTYEFVPGPFTLALTYAVKNPSEKVALVIEELNRGNAPSIFGDIFQLLDRKNDGVSRYPIMNLNIQKHISKNMHYIDIQNVVIPGNLYIYATMNTSDQNVFTLDTAFKRRWKFKKISNKFATNEEIGEMYVPGLNGYAWKDFVEKINNYIIDNQVSLSDEDKQLGKYFVSKDMLLKQGEDDTQEKKEEFAYKVFEYLWHDVAKFNRDKWFKGEIKSLDALIDQYVKDGDVFASGITFTPKTQSSQVAQSSPVAQPQSSTTGTESDESDSMSNNEDK